jgi:uncharacterized membrane protein
METEGKTIVEEPAVKEKNTTAIIAYLTFIGLIIAFVMNNEKKEPFASYHIRQSLGLVLTSLVLSFINVIPVLGWIISLLGFLLLIYMWIVGLINAIKSKELPVPFLGKQYAEWFKSL